jgi:hypothetical protein
MPSRSPWWQQAGTTNWHKEIVASGTGNQGYADPALVWTGARVEITGFNGGNLALRI